MTDIQMFTNFRTEDTSIELPYDENLFLNNLYPASKYKVDELNKDNIDLLKYNDIQKEIDYVIETIKEDIRSEKQEMTIETKRLSTTDDMEVSNIYLDRINKLEEKLKKYEEGEKAKDNIRYDFNRINKINIIRNYSKKYNLDIHFTDNQLSELNEQDFDKIYGNIYNINESRKNSLLYYGICCIFIWGVNFVYNKVKINSNKNLLEKFTFEVFSQNLLDSFIIFENEYFPTDNKIRNPSINIIKFLAYFCAINLLFDDKPIPANLSI